MADRPRRWLPLLVGAAAFALYTATAAPSIVELYADSLEFQLVGPTFGIAHPTGYPLYTLLGALWSRVLFPFGNWAWRMNLFSALSGAGAVVFVFLLAQRLSDSLLGGLAAALAFGLSPVWWQQTTVAEVYALHLLFVAAILHVAVGTREKGGTGGTGSTLPSPSPPPPLPPSPDRPVTLSPPPLSALFLLLGLSLTHHRTTVLLLPGLAVYLLWRVPGIWRPQRRWIGWGLALVLPLLLYGTIPLRAWMGATDLEGDYVNTGAGFWRHVLASGYTGFFAANPLAVDRSAADWWQLFRAQFGWPGLLLGGAGLVAGLVRRRLRPEWSLVALTLTANALFAFNYRVGDVEVFFLPVFLCLALGIGNAVGGRWQGAGRRQARPQAPGPRPELWVQDHTPRTAHRAVRFLQPALLVVLLLGLGGRGPAVNRRDDWAVHDYAVAMAKVDFPPGSRVVGLRGQMTALEYMQKAEHEGVNAVPVALDDPGQRRDFVEKAVAAGYPVYLTQELTGIEDRFSFSGAGPLVRVWPRGEAEVGAPQHGQETLLAGGALRLVGYDLVCLDQAGGPALRVAFYWQPTRSLSRTLKVSLRLLAEDGSLLQQEDRFPLRQVAPTWSWLPGETVRDVYDIALLQDTSPQRIRIVLYDAETVAEINRFDIALPGSESGSIRCEPFVNLTKAVP